LRAAARRRKISLPDECRNLKVARAPDYVAKEENEKGPDHPVPFRLNAFWDEPPRL
jgi:hypothetical protein